MKALLLPGPGEPLVEIDTTSPALAPDDVRIEVHAAGICHSDVHYRSGVRKLDTLPVIPGHEVAGTIAAVGDSIDPARIGTRVAVHYVISDGTCPRCGAHGEQFCVNYGMVGVTRSGGFAEAIVVPARNAVPVPDSLAIEHAAVMMCSTSTALHGLRKGRLAPGDTVAVFGVGGLGMSALQLALALGAGRVVAVDIDDERLATASDLGAVPVRAEEATAYLVNAGGANVGLDLVGSFDVLRSAIDSAAPRGRVVSVGLTEGTMAINPYDDLIRREVELIGCNDHLLQDIVDIFEFANAGRLAFDDIVTGTVALEAGAVNEVMDRMERFGPGVRTVIRPRE